MKQKKQRGLLIVGSLPQSGVCFYSRMGRTVVRTASSQQPRRNTRAQFETRQRMKHAVSLWQRLKWCEPLLGGTEPAYNRFLSLSKELPTVYTPSRGLLSGASFLMPGIPVSEGRLKSVEQCLGTLNDKPALLTSLSEGSLSWVGDLRLYMLQQVVQGEEYTVLAESREVDRNELVANEGRLALVGDEYADPMRGWALARVDGQRCSTQRIVTRCTVYEAFTTEEAKLVAVDSYGGFTDD